MPPELDVLGRKLSELVGAEHVLSGPAAAPFTVDGVRPELAVRPGTQDEVAGAVAACSAAGARVICWGGGAAMRLGNPPTALDVVLSLDRLDRIVELDAANLNVSAEAGVRLSDLQRALAEHREFLPLDPARPEHVTVGGLVAANASGPTRLLYGPARDWVLGLRVVLPDGQRVRCGGKVIKNVSGYDLEKLFIGSMGTLGIVTEATFKLLPFPATRATVVGVLPDAAAVAAVVSRTLGSHLLPEALEALDAQALAAVGATLAVGGASGVALAVALAGSRETVERQVRDFERFFAEAKAVATATLGPEQGEAAWRAIRDVHATVGATLEERVTVKIAVPIGRTLELFAAAQGVARRSCWQAAVTAHAGSGIVRAAYALDGAGVGPMRGAVEALRAEAERVEGSLVLETAPAALKRHVDAWGKPRDGFSVMRRLKAQFDPRGLMSPGRFIGGI